MSKPIVKYYIDGKYQEATVRDAGDLSKLKTKVKSDLVSAINSIYNGEGGVSSENIKEINDELNGLQKEINDLVESNINIKNDASQFSKELNKTIQDLSMEMNGLIKNAIEETGKIDERINKVYGDYIQSSKEFEMAINDAKGDIDATEERVREYQKSLENIDLNVGDIEASIDKINKSLKATVTKNQFDLMESRVETLKEELSITAEGLKHSAKKGELDTAIERMAVYESELEITAKKLDSKLTREEVLGEIENEKDYAANLIRGTRNWSGWDKDGDVDKTSETYRNKEIAKLRRNGSGIWISADGLEIGETYTFSLSAMSKGENVTVTINGNDMKTQANDDTFLGDGYHRVYQHIIADKESMTLKISVKGLKSGEDLSITSAKFEKGSKNTPWVDHTDDMYARTVSYENRFQQLADKLLLDLKAIEKANLESGQRLTSNETNIEINAKGLAQLTRELVQNNEQTTLMETEIKNISGELSERITKREFASELDNLELDGSNLITNSNFIKDFDFWSIGDKKYQIKEIDGANYASMTRTGIGAVSIAGISTHAIEVTDRDRLSIAFDMIASNLDDTRVFYVELFDIEGKRLSRTEYTIKDLFPSFKDGVLSRSEFTYIVSNEAAIRAKFTMALYKNGTVNFSKISVIKGNVKAFGWSPAHRDSDILVAKLETQIKKKADGIELTSARERIDKVTKEVELVDSKIEFSAEKMRSEFKENSKGFATKSEVEQTANGMKETYSKVETTIKDTNKRLNSLEVDTNNLIINSNQPKSKTGYKVTEYLLTEQWITGQEYTIQIKGEINSGQSFGVWLDVGSIVGTTNMIYDKTNGVYYGTFLAKPPYGKEHSKMISVYNYPSSGAKESSIEWIKLTKGSVRSPWSPTKKESDEILASSLNTGSRNYYMGSDVYVENINQKNINSSVEYNKGLTDDFLDGINYYRNKDLLCSIDIEIRNGTFRSSNDEEQNTKYSRVGFEFSIEYIDGTRTYLGCWKYIREPNVNFKGRIHSSYKILDKEIKSIHYGGVYIQANGDYMYAGRPKVAMSNQINDDSINWTLAPEDLESSLSIGRRNYALDSERERLIQSFYTLVDVSSDIVQTNGKAMTLSFDAKRTDKNTEIGDLFGYLRSKTDPIKPESVKMGNVIGKEWKRFAITIPPIKDKSTVVSVGINVAIARNAEILVKNIKLESGYSSNSAEWTPAPDDMANKAEVDEKFKTTTVKIASLEKTNEGFKQQVGELNTKVSKSRNGILNMARDSYIRATSVAGQYAYRSLSEINPVKPTGFALEPNTEYTITAKGKASPHGDTKVIMQNPPDYNFSKNVTFRDKNKLEVGSVTFTTPKTGNTYFNIEAYDMAKKGGSYVEWIVVSRGGIPVDDWIPSPEDGVKESQEISSKLATLEHTSNGFKKQISDVENKVDGISVGGTNLMIDSENKHVYSFGGSKMENIDNVEFPKWNTKLAKRAKGSGGTSTIIGVISSGKNTPENKTVEGNDYVHSIYIHNNHTKNKLRISNNILESEYLKPSEGKMVAIKGVGDGKQIIQFVFAVDKIGEEFDFTYYHPKIEEGTVATAWSPAPEDMVTKPQFQDTSKRLTTIEETSKGVVQQVSEVSSKIDNLSIEGRNYFKDTSDEYKKVVLNNRMKITVKYNDKSGKLITTKILTGDTGETLTINAEPPIRHIVIGDKSKVVKVGESDIEIIFVIERQIIPTNITVEYKFGNSIVKTDTVKSNMDDKIKITGTAPANYRIVGSTTQDITVLSMTTKVTFTVEKIPAVIKVQYHSNDENKIIHSYNENSFMGDNYKVNSKPITHYTIVAPTSQDVKVTATSMTVTFKLNRNKSVVKVEYYSDEEKKMIGTKNINAFMGESKVIPSNPPLGYATVGTASVTINIDNANKSHRFIVKKIPRTPSVLTINYYSDQDKKNIKTETRNGFIDDTINVTASLPTGYSVKGSATQSIKLTAKAHTITFQVAKIASVITVEYYYKGAINSSMTEKHNHFVNDKVKIVGKTHETIKYIGKTFEDIVVTGTAHKVRFDVEEVLISAKIEVRYHSTTENKIVKTETELGYKYKQSKITGTNPQYHTITGSNIQTIDVKNVNEIVVFNVTRNAVTIMVNYVDKASNKMIKSVQVSGYEGLLKTINAEKIEGYKPAEPSSQTIMPAKGSVITFKIEEDNNLITNGWTEAKFGGSEPLTKDVYDFKLPFGDLGIEYDEELEIWFDGVANGGTQGYYMLQTESGNRMYLSGWEPINKFSTGGTGNTVVIRARNKPEWDRSKATKLGFTFSGMGGGQTISIKNMKVKKVKYNDPVGVPNARAASSPLMAENPLSMSAPAMTPRRMSFRMAAMPSPMSMAVLAQKPLSEDMGVHHIGTFDLDGRIDVNKNMTFSAGVKPTIDLRLLVVSTDASGKETRYVSNATKSEGFLDKTIMVDKSWRNVKLYLENVNKEATNIVYYKMAQAEMGDSRSAWKSAEEDIYKLVGKVSSLEHTANGFEFKINDFKSISDAKNAMSNGKVLHTDVDFIKGSNGVSIYNNSKNGSVDYTRENYGNGFTNPSGGARLKFTHTGAGSPELGGFYQPINSRSNAIFVQKYVAALPKGYKFMSASNPMGDGMTRKWLTSNEGTGDWEEYILMIHCGRTGNFSTGGHMYISGATPTKEKPLIWWLDSATTIDVSQSNQVQLSILSDKIAGAVTKSEHNALTGKVDTFNTSLSMMAGQLDLRVSRNNIVSSFNMSPESMRLKSKFIHLSGDSLIDAAVIGTAMIKDAAITDAKIASLSANKIVARDLEAITAKTGNLTVTGWLRLSTENIGIQGSYDFGDKEAAYPRWYSGTYQLSHRHLRFLADQYSVSGGRKGSHHGYGESYYGSNYFKSRWYTNSSSSTLKGRIDIRDDFIQVNDNWITNETSGTWIKPNYIIATSLRTYDISAKPSVDNVYFNENRSDLADLKVGKDKNGKSVVSKAIHERTYNSQPTVCVTDYGTLGRIVSAKKYKRNISTADNLIEKSKDVLKINPSQWMSKNRPDDDTLHYGFIADDFDDLGLTEVVLYSSKGDIEGLSYDRISTYHNVILSEHEKEINKLKERIKILEGKLNNENFS